MRRVLVLGATAAMVQSTLRCFAAAGDRLFLVARSAEKLDAVALDLRARHRAEVATRVLDLADTSAHPDLIEQAQRWLDRVDVALIAHGVLGDQQAAELDFREAENVLQVNLLSVVSLLTPIAALCQAQRSGIIAVVSSVAGERGRPSNYVYGASKGALSIYLEGLRARLHGAGVRVVTIKPGLVQTPMTAHKGSTALTANADRVGRSIYRALHRGGDVVYVPWFWRWIMLVIRLIPGALFKRLRL